MWETYDEMMQLSHILDCDLVYDDLPCNCDGRPTAFWETNWKRKYGQDKKQA